MESNTRREANTRRRGVLRKSVAQLAVLGLVAGGAIFAFSAGAGAGQAPLPQNCGVAGWPHNADVQPNVDISRHYLQLCKSGPETAVAGTDVTYTLTPTVADSGKHEDDVLTVSDTLPAGLTLVGTPTGDGWDCSASAGSQVTCTAPNTLDPPPWPVAYPVITVDAHVASSVTDASVQNCATLSIAEGSHDAEVAPATPQNDEAATTDPACWTTDITQSSDLAVTKTGPSSATAPGTVDYTITVTNNGPSDSGAITLTDPLPLAKGVAFVSSTTDTGWTCSGTGTLTCTHAGLASGASSSFGVTLSLDASVAGQALTNCATVTVGDTSGVTDNNTGCSSTIEQVAIQVSPEVVTPVVVQPAFTG